MNTIFMNPENSKTSNPQKPLLNLSDKIKLTLWLPLVAGDPRNLGESCETTFVSFVLRFVPFFWSSINLLICVKKCQVTVSSLYK